MKRVLLIISFLFFLFSFNNVSYSENEIPLNRESMEKLHQLKDMAGSNAATINILKIEEIFGSLAPVAISPFFGITLTSGASILADKQIIKNNDFLKTNKLLANYYVFSIFLMLTILTSIPNLSKISKSANTVVTYMEDKASAVIYLVMLLVILVPGATIEQQAPLVLKAGFVDFSHTTLILIAALINYAVIQYVRYFLELLILISPIPLVDAFFELLKKSSAFILFGIYLYSPLTAFILNMIILLISLLVFNKVNKLRRYLMYVYVEPKLAFLFDIKPELVSTNTANKLKNLKNYKSEPEILIPVFPLTRAGKIKVKDRSWLLADSTGLYLYRFPLFKPVIVENLDKYGNLKIGADLTHAKIYNNQEAKDQLILVMNNHYKQHYQQIVKQCNLSDEKNIGLKKIWDRTKDRLNQRITFFDKVKEKLLPESEILE